MFPPTQQVVVLDGYALGWMLEERSEPFYAPLIPCCGIAKVSPSTPLPKPLSSGLRTCAYDRCLWDDKWGEAVNLCRSYLSDRDWFQEEEIAYKLRLVSAIREALDPEQGTKGFGQRLRRAFTNSENNLTNWQAHDRFARWAMEEPERAKEAVGALVSEGQSVENRLNGFLQRVPSEAVSGLGTRICIASYLLMGTDPENYPFYKPTPFDKVERLLGWPRTLEEESPGEVYAHHLRFARRFFEELRLGT